MNCKTKRSKDLAKAGKPLQGIAHVVLSTAGISPESIIVATKAVYRQTIGRL